MAQAPCSADARDSGYECHGSRMTPRGSLLVRLQVQRCPEKSGSLVVLARHRGRSGRQRVVMLSNGQARDNAGRAIGTRVGGDDDEEVDNSKLGLQAVVDF